MRQIPTEGDGLLPDASLDSPPATRPGGSPAEVSDQSDPGDATQRNFRYQHSYGVVLLIAAASGKLPYVAIWCEQHEDILAERLDGKWDGYQVKTRQREDGQWTLSNQDFCEALKHLALLDARFPELIEGLHVVSNAQFLKTEDPKRAHLSPYGFLDAIRRARAIEDLSVPFDSALLKLAARTSLEPHPLFSALRKTKLLEGPQRESFDAEIAQDHICTLEGCADLPRSRLAAIRDELVARVFRASSLFNEDPARHWCCVSGEDRNYPRLAAKRVSVDEVRSALIDTQIPFRYLPASSSLAVGTAFEKIPAFERKLLAAGLQSQVEALRMKMLSTERRLLELAERQPERVRPLLDQLENVVKGEYAEALLALRQRAAPYGAQLLSDVYQRLRAISRERQELVEREPYESLVGVAALLTAECQLGWGPPFDLGS